MLTCNEIASDLSGLRLAYKNNPFMLVLGQMTIRYYCILSMRILIFHLRDNPSDG